MGNSQSQDQDVLMASLANRRELDISKKLSHSAYVKVSRLRKKQDFQTAFLILDLDLAYSYRSRCKKMGYPNDIGSRFPYRIATIWTF